MEHNNFIICVLGHRGSGKSTWLYRNIESFTPFVLVDPLYDEKFDRLNLYKIQSVDEAIQLFKKGNPSRIYISPNVATFDLFCGLCLAKGNMTLVVDEVDHYATNYYISPYFKKLVKYGRHVQVNLVMVARRPKEIHPLLRSQASRFIVFPIGGEDIKELQSHIGNEAKKIEYLKSSNNQSEYLDYNFSSKTSSIKNINYLIDT